MKTKTLRNALLGLVMAVLFLMPLALPQAVVAQGGSGKNYFQVFGSAARGTTTSATQNISQVQSTGMVGFLDATAQSGTSPTLDVVVYDSYSSSGPWSTLITFTQITAATGNQVIAASRSPASYVRAIATVGGSSTPLYTFSLYVMAFGGPSIAVTTTQGGAASFTGFSFTGANGTAATITTTCENVTLATGGATTDTTANLLPANSLILNVTAIVTTSITTSTGWQLGDASVAGRFTASNTTMTAGTRDTGSVMWLANTTSSGAGPYQVAAAKVRITVAGGNAGAGAIRVCVTALTFTAPTS